MKYSYYLPLVSLATGGRFVYIGRYDEDAAGIITLASGEKCRRDENFPS